ncbi:MAG: hydrogenase maturation protease [Pseudomonadota bacterium]
MKPIAIIGVGNYLRQDEGVGIHATQLLRKKIKRADCEIIDAGVPSVALLHMLENRSLVIIVDCADFAGQPGEIKTFQPEQIKHEEKKEISLHATDLMTVFEMAKSMGISLPSIFIIGIQPETVEQGMELSEPVQKSLQNLPDLVKKILEEKIIRH